MRSARRARGAVAALFFAVAVLASPALIGVTADATSLRAALLAMPLAAALVLLLTPVLPARR